MGGKIFSEAVVMDNRGTSRVGHSVIRPMLMLDLDLDFIQVMDKFQEFFARIGYYYPARDELLNFFSTCMIVI